MDDFQNWLDFVNDDHQLSYQKSWKKNSSKGILVVSNNLDNIQMLTKPLV